MTRQIVLSYSLEGALREVSQYLASELNIPFKQLVPKDDINKDGSSKYFTGGEQVVYKKTPELEPLDINLGEYDTVFLGSPIWSGSFAPAIRSILERGLLKGKRIAFFYAHEGAPGMAEERIKNEVNKYSELISLFEMVDIDDGFDHVKADVLNWARSIALQDNNII